MVPLSSSKNVPIKAAESLMCDACTPYSWGRDVVCVGAGVRVGGEEGREGKGCEGKEPVMNLHLKIGPSLQAFHWQLNIGGTDS